jgi:IMP dehydrogenase
MAGSLFAGVEESPGESIIYEAVNIKTIRGMGSIEAMKEGSKDRYFQDAEKTLKNSFPKELWAGFPIKVLLLKKFTS